MTTLPGHVYPLLRWEQSIFYLYQAEVQGVPDSRKHVNHSLFSVAGRYATAAASLGHPHLNRYLYQTIIGLNCLFLGQNKLDYLVLILLIALLDVQITFSIFFFPFQCVIMLSYFFQIL
ncbi:hypothetical protein ACJX0J_032633 [Zea mays]